MFKFRIQPNIFNYLIPIYLSAHAYENILFYTFKIPVPISILKLLVIVYIIILLSMSRRYLNFRIYFIEIYFYITIILLFIFSFLNFTGIKYAISMLFLFLFLFLLKNIKNFLDFNKIIKITLYLNIPIIVLNFILIFNNHYYSYKHQFFGTHGNPNILGIYLVFMLAIIYLNYKIKKTISLLLLFFLVEIIIILTISRSSILSSIFFIILFLKQNKKIFLFLIIFFLVIFSFYGEEIEYIHYIQNIQNRIEEGNTRQFDLMIKLIIDNNFLPHGTNTFSNLMKKMGGVADNSYFFLLNDLGFLGILYYIPFLYIICFSNFEVRLLFLPLLIHSFFEKILISTTNQYLFLFLIMIYVFHDKLRLKKR